MQWRAGEKLLGTHCNELIKPEVLSTNVELAHEITSWVEGCAARAEGPKDAAFEPHHLLLRGGP